MGFLTDSDEPLRIPSPFIRYYGGKYSTAHHYPRPLHSTIIEPFAGAAGYALHYPMYDVILIEKYEKLAAIWRYLIKVSEDELIAIPSVNSVLDLPPNLPTAAHDLVGFWMAEGTASPRLNMPKDWKWASDSRGWSDFNKQRLAAGLKHIRHWQIIEGEYTDAPNIEATWFVDPPYNNLAGKTYKHSKLDYSKLAKWCNSRKGQTIVCENVGADWLPFSIFNPRHKGSHGKNKAGEAIYYQETR